MKVFADLHHGDLYYSLHLLFEKRLGWELYRPIGMDWFHEGYWKIAEPYGNALDTVGQYLNIANTQWDQYKNLNGNHYVEAEVYYIHEPVHNYYQRAITLDKFKSMKFDIILPTIKAHDATYESLRNRFMPNAKVVAQMGNTDQKTHLTHVLHSAPYTPKQGQNALYYHQELDMNLYSYTKPDPNTKNITSVVNCFPYPHLFNQYKARLPEATFRAYGAGSPNGSLFGAKGVAEKMKETNVAWQMKPQQGLGHSAMGWMASGRPVVINNSQMKHWGGTAPLLYEPGVTCHALDEHPEAENIKMIRSMLEPENNTAWCERAYKRFKEIINYDEEERKIRDFFSKVLS